MYLCLKECICAVKSPFTECPSVVVLYFTELPSVFVLSSHSVLKSQCPSVFVP